ncbi:unnamed protein product [Coffea canephora]|uniref:Uncharacterized protein n=1 Tax=Coffea canephora TaxID=49390 RepID=A0A068VDC7_COFCA|nr:unnamed protein product [Coffea canephora]
MFLFHVSIARRTNWNRIIQTIATELKKSSDILLEAAAAVAHHIEE